VIFLYFIIARYSVLLGTSSTLNATITWLYFYKCSINLVKYGWLKFNEIEQIEIIQYFWSSQTRIF